MVERQQDVAQAAVSYSIGCATPILCYLADLAETAQALGIIGGCLIVGIRLIHDAIALYRFVKDPNKK